MIVMYYYGYVLEFEKVNVHAISPHEIVFNKYGYNLLVLHYDDYMENENLYFVDGEKEPFTISTIKRYIR